MSWNRERFSGDDRSDVFDPLPDFPNPPKPRFAPVRESTFYADIDWQETPDAHVFTADVPGMKKGEVAVEIRRGNVLEISGARSLDKGGMKKSDTWHLFQRRSGGFVRRFKFPENVEVDRVGASMENGVLTVTVPKEEVKKPEVISVDIEFVKIAG